MNDTYQKRILYGVLAFAAFGLVAPIAHASGWYGGGGNSGGNGAFTASAVLNGMQEVPSVSTNAYGNFSANSSATASTTMQYTLSAFNIEDLTAAHLHCARTGFNGPVVVELFSNASSTSVNGVFATSTITNASIAAAGSTCATPIHDIDDLKLAIARGEIYVNIHSLDYPNGEIRGQVQGSGNFGHGYKKCYCYGFMNYECQNNNYGNYGHGSYDDKWSHKKDKPASPIPSIPDKPSIPDEPEEPEQPEYPKAWKWNKHEDTHSHQSVVADISDRLRVRLGR